MKKNVLQLIRRVLLSQLVSGSFVLFVGNILVNLGSYLFHLLMGRMLGPSDYGILASLISLTYLFGIPVTTLSLVVVRYVSFLKGKNENEKISFLYHSLNRRLTIFSIISFLLLIIISPIFDNFLHLNSLFLVWLIILSSLANVYLSLNLSVLQGYLKFIIMSWLGILQIVAKLLFSVTLVFLSLKVFGAAFAIFASTLVSCWVSYYSIRPLLTKKEERGDLAKREFINYTFPVFLSSLAFTSFYMIDVILARHFLLGEEAGYYASLSTLGKIIFFASSPVVMTMFPLVSESHGAGKKFFHYLILSFSLVLGASIIVSTIYYFYPKLMVTLLFGNKFLSASEYLFPFAIFLSLYSLNYLIVNFYLSVKKVWVVVFPLFFALIQILLIFLFHKSLFQIIQICILVSGLLLITLLIYCLISYVNEKKHHLVSDRTSV